MSPLYLLLWIHGSEEFLTCLGCSEVPPEAERLAEVLYRNTRIATLDLRFNALTHEGAMVLLSAKLLDDECYNNHYWASVGCVRAPRPRERRAPAPPRGVS